ncbi:hypothetical protein OMR07_27740, partial [Methylobacterium organophilum]|nr:hypothetical protein [Methylobacterium organophilum]
SLYCVTLSTGVVYCGAFRVPCPFIAGKPIVKFRRTLASLLFTCLAAGAFALIGYLVSRR